jgi:hypothetical protein
MITETSLLNCTRFDLTRQEVNLAHLHVSLIKPPAIVVAGLSWLAFASCLLVFIKVTTGQTLILRIPRFILSFHLYE